jgi:nucleotide-binding universal stress UspA family protein
LRVRHFSTGSLPPVEGFPGHPAAAVFRHVLLGLDFSVAADHALTEAIELAERHGGRLTILTAVPEVRGWGGGPVESVTAAVDLNAQLEREAVALQHRALERVPACLPVATIIRRAPARAALLDLLRDGCFDAVVIGASTCRRRLRLTRSLTRCLIAHAGVPVVVAEAGRPSELHLPPGVAGDDARAAAVVPSATPRSAST